MSESTEDSNGPKIIVDSDWKEQVAKEKEQLTQQDDSSNESAAAPKAGPSDDAGDVASAPSDDVTQFDGSAQPDGPAQLDSSAQQLPPASFEVLVSMLFTQAIASLGQLPGQEGQTPQIDKSMAKHSIDTLEILEEKTKGNLTPEESKLLGEALHSLRMAYVSVRG